MSESSKVFMFPEGTTSSVDPNLMMALNQNGGFNNGNWIWILFLFLLYGNNGFSGNNNLLGTGYLSNQISNDTGRDLLMQAINGNGTAIQNLANNLNVDLNSIQTAVNSVAGSIAQVGNQVGMSGMQVINAIQSGNQALASQIASCCCENKLLVTNMGYEGQIRDLQNTASLTSRLDQLANGITQGFASVGYETAQQTNALQNSLQGQTQTIIDKLSNIESNAQQDKINTLTAELTAANARAERQSELQPIIQQLNAIKGAQPSTVAVQYPQLTAYPSYLNGYSSNSFWG